VEIGEGESTLFELVTERVEDGTGRIVRVMATTTTTITVSTFMFRRAGAAAG
jgi:hypothetical protein